VSRSLALVLIAAVLVGLPASAFAHDVPNEVTVNVFIKPEGERLRLLVRVPLKAVRDVDFPRRRGGFLDLARADPALREAAERWLASEIELYEGETRLPPPRVVEARASLESDRSFGSFDEALAHLTGVRLPNDLEILPEQVQLDALLEYPIRSERSDFAIRPALERLGWKVLVVVRFLPPGGEVRAFELSDNSELVRLDPRWYQAALRFVEAGFLHILDGTDHLLFLLLLVIPFRRIVPLVMVITAFTVAHSITLIASAYSLAPQALWFPPLIETLIAISILYMAIENVIGSNVRRRWLIAFGFGLVHGFGFSFALREQLQFAGSHLLTSLVSFNVGVELGQLLVLVLLVPLLDLLFRFVVPERLGTIILSVLVGHTAWHWMLERADKLRQFPWPQLTSLQIASALRWLILVLIAGAALWAGFALLQRRNGRRSSEPER
jgi:hypothetical protein